MRRGIGVAYAQNKAAKEKQLADLGDTIAAERVGTITNELDALTLQLQQLAAQHKDRVREDPILRARFRQLAQSLGADILSSRENLFSKQSGLDDFYSALASEVVLVCMQESHYTGPYVPVRNVLAALKRLRGSSATTEITEDDVIAAIARLSILGGEYATVQLGGETYINTVSGGGGGGGDSGGVDTLTADGNCIMSAVGAVLQAKRRKLDGSDERAEEHRRAIANYNFRVGGTAGLSALSHHHSAPHKTSAAVIPPEALYPRFTLQEIRDALPPMLAQNSALRRVEAALQQLITSGQVWVDVDPTDGDANTKTSIVGGMSFPADLKTVKPPRGGGSSAPAPQQQQFTFSSGGAMHVGVGGFNANTLASTAIDNGFVNIGAHTLKQPSSADVLEHPAVSYWFVAFLQ